VTDQLGRARRGADGMDRQGRPQDNGVTDSESTMEHGSELNLCVDCLKREFGISRPDPLCTARATSEKTQRQNSCAHLNGPRHCGATRTDDLRRIDTFPAIWEQFDHILLRSGARF